MSAQIILLGFGDVNNIVTLGLLSGQQAVVIVDTHDGFNDKKSAKRFINKDRQAIRSIIEQSVYGSLDIETEKEIEFVAKKAIVENQFEVSKEQVNAIVAEIYATIAARKAKAELDDEESILVLMH